MDNTMHIVRLTTSDGDWEAVYINGALIDQGHNVPLDRLLRSKAFEKALGRDIQGYLYQTMEFSADQMDELGGNFPEHLKEFPKNTESAFTSEVGVLYDPIKENNV